MIGWSELGAFMALGSGDVEMEKGTENEKKMEPDAVVGPGREKKKKEKLPGSKLKKERRLQLERGPEKVMETEREHEPALLKAQGNKKEEEQQGQQGRVLETDMREQKLKEVKIEGVKFNFSNATDDKTNGASSSSLSDGADSLIQTLPPVQGPTGGPTRRSSKGGWTPEQDEILRRAVQCYKGRNWKKIAEYFPERSDVQCLHRWQKVINPDLVKGPWTKEEDDKIVELVAKHGAQKWSLISRSLPGRIGKQCRERWHNHLNPTIKRDAWTQQEELALIRAHQIYGNKWAEITKYLPGRTDNSIKNHWNSSAKKKVASYLASGLLTELPDLSGFQQLLLSSSSTTEDMSNGTMVPGLIMEQISDCNLESPSRGGNFSSRVDVLPTTVQPKLKNLDVQNAANNWKFGGEIRDLPKTSLPLCSKTEGSALPTPDGALGFVDVSSAEAAVPASSHELCNLPESIVTGNGCSNDSSREHMNAFNISDCVVSSAFGLQPQAPTFDAVHKMPSSVLTCQMSSSINVDIATPSLCVSTLRASWSALASVSSDVRSSLGGTVQTQSSENLSSDLNNCNQANGVCHQCASEVRQPDKLPQEERTVAGMLSGGCDVDGMVALDMKLVNCFAQTESPNSESLFYGPRHLLNWDMPFINCDVMNSCCCIHQACSPLGGQQMAMTAGSSASSRCSSLSPSNEKSPEAVLRSAAKSFTSTPSILRKRRRYSSNFLQRNCSEENVNCVTNGNTLCPIHSLVHSYGSLVTSLDAEFKNCSTKDGIDDSFPSPSGQEALMSPPDNMKAKNLSVVKPMDRQLEHAFESSKQILSENINDEGASKGLHVSEGDVRHIIGDVDHFREPSPGEIVKVQYTQAEADVTHMMDHNV